MALTPSTMMDLGTKAPDFLLNDVISNAPMSFDNIAGTKGTVIMFICRHCPYVIHVQNEIARIADHYLPEGIGFVAISSNDVDNYPEDAPEFLKEQAANIGFHFPYLYDESQEIARSYDAACTPDFFVFDQHRSCIYRGRMDEATPGNGKANDGRELRVALDNLIAGNAISKNQFPSMGCNIKWKG